MSHPKFVDAMVESLIDFLDKNPEKHKDLLPKIHGWHNIPLAPHQSPAKPQLNQVIRLLSKGSPEVLKNCSQLAYENGFGGTFNHIYFKDSKDRDLGKEYFLNPEHLSASSVNSLSFHNVEEMNKEDVRWIKSFNKLNKLEVSIQGHKGWQTNSNAPRTWRVFAPFEGLSPDIKSLIVCWHALPLQQVFNLICSFPCLEDLCIEGAGWDVDGAVFWGANLSGLTGTLKIQSKSPDFLHQLLKLERDLNFREIIWKEGKATGFEGVANLVEKCFNNLESIDIDCPVSSK